MAININYQLREQMSHNATIFPISFFVVNLLCYRIRKVLCIGIQSLKLQLRNVEVGKCPDKRYLSGTTRATKRL